MVKDEESWKGGKVGWRWSRTGGSMLTPERFDAKIIIVNSPSRSFYYLLQKYLPVLSGVMQVTRPKRRTSAWLWGGPRLFYRGGLREEEEEKIADRTEVKVATG